MANTLHLTVVTPERALIDENVDEVQLPGLGGYLGVLPGHAPLFSELQTGVLGYRQGARTENVAVSGGFVEVLDDAVRVLADVAEPPVRIDVERAMRARKRAEERIGGGSHETDYARAQGALERAATRLRVAGKAE